MPECQGARVPGARCQSAVPGCRGARCQVPGARVPVPGARVLRARVLASSSVGATSALWHPGTLHLGTPAPCTLAPCTLAPWHPAPWHPGTPALCNMCIPRCPRSRPASGPSAHYKWWVVAMLWCICVLQLRRPPGDLLGLSAARTRDAPDAGPARAARLGVRVGLWARGAVGRHGRRSRAPQDRDPRRPARLERHLHGDGAVAQLPAPVSSSAPPKDSARRSTFRRRCRSSAITTAATRARARMGLHQTSVYIGTIGGGFFAGLIGRALRLAAVVRRVRRAGRAARARAAPVPVEPPRGAADAPSWQARTRSARVRRARLRRVPPPASARTPTLLCLLGAFMCANFVAVVLLSWMPKFLYDRFHMGLAMAGPDRDGLRAAREHGRRAGRRLARRRVAPALAARTAWPCRRSACSAARRSWRCAA